MNHTHKAHLLDSPAPLSVGVKGQHSIIPSFPSPHPYSSTSKQFCADAHTHTVPCMCNRGQFTEGKRETLLGKERGREIWLIGCFCMSGIFSCPFAPCDLSQTHWAGVSPLVAFHPSTCLLKWFPLSTLTHTRTHSPLSFQVSPTFPLQSFSQVKC